MSDEVGRNALIGAELPSNRARGSFERVHVTFRQVCVEDHEVAGDDRIAMKARVLIRMRVVLPANGAGVFVEGVEDTGAGSDKQLIPSDRWGDRQSTAGVVLPE